MDRDVEPDFEKIPVHIVDARFDHPGNVPVLFRFPPHASPSSLGRLQRSVVTRTSVDDRDIYTLDGFFENEEAEELRTFSANATFGKEIHSDDLSRDSGETAIAALAPRERWSLFSRPPGAIRELFRLFSCLASHLEAEFCTLPWELHRGARTATAVTTNRVARQSAENTHLGKHQDCRTLNGIPFDIPDLCHDGAMHAHRFVNGAPGKPWLMTLLLYVTAPDFHPEFGLGTVFFDDERVLIADCRHMRLVLFDSEVTHSIQESSYASDIETWRVSYAIRFLLNPRRSDPPLSETLASILTQTAALPRGLDV